MQEYFFPKKFYWGKLQNIYSTMFTVTICSELIPQNILQTQVDSSCYIQKPTSVKVVQSPHRVLHCTYIQTK